MYTREEASRLKQEFWTTFGKYMSPVPSAEGMKINWVNYKTGVKNVYFFMEADTRKASIGIRLSHPDADLQKIFFEEFEKLHEVLEGFTQEKWKWILYGNNEHNKTISLIFTETGPVSIFNKNDWPAIISFFKPRLVALDAFWSEWKYAFENLDDNPDQRG